MNRKLSIVASISVSIAIVPACEPIIKTPNLMEKGVAVVTRPLETEKDDQPSMISDLNAQVTVAKVSGLNPSQAQAILDKAVKDLLPEFKLNYGKLIKTQQSMLNELVAKRDQYRRQMNAMERQTPRFGLLMSQGANRAGIFAAILHIENDITKVEENLVELDKTRDLNLLSVAWRLLTHRQRLDILHSGCLSEFNKTALLKVQAVPDTDKIPAFMNCVGIVLREVPAGKFSMGESGSIHTNNAGRVRQVAITSSIWMGETEVTQEQFQKVCGYNPTNSGKSSGNDSLSTELPVDRITWFEAVRFCKLLSEKEKERAQGNTYRLPTEAEWEYVGRAGTTTTFSFGGFEKLRGKEANVDYSNANRASVGHLLPPRSYPPNNFGFWDMHGNANEWCGDWFADNYYDSAVDIDPAGPLAGSSTRKVVRGDSCFTKWDATSGSHRRDSLPPTVANAGLRVVCEKGRPSDIATSQFKELADFDSRNITKP